MKFLLISFAALCNSVSIASAYPYCDLTVSSSSSFGYIEYQIQPTSYFKKHQTSTNNLRFSEDLEMQTDSAKLQKGHGYRFSLDLADADFTGSGSPSAVRMFRVPMSLMITTRLMKLQNNYNGLDKFMRDLIMGGKYGTAIEELKCISSIRDGISISPSAELPNGNLKRAFGSVLSLESLEGTDDSESTMIPAHYPPMHSSTTANQGTAVNFDICKQSGIRGLFRGKVPSNANNVGTVDGYYYQWLIWSPKSGLVFVPSPLVKRTVSANEESYEIKFYNIGSVDDAMSSNESDYFDVSMDSI